MGFILSRPFKSSTDPDADPGADPDADVLLLPAVPGVEARPLRGVFGSSADDEPARDDAREPVVELGIASSARLSLRLALLRALKGGVVGSWSGEVMESVVGWC